MIKISRDSESSLSSWYREGETHINRRFSLSVASFAILFSHSEGHLFTLLIVSFVVQKLLILIRSHLFILEKAMATHSTVLAWRIPGMGEPGGLPSLGSHRVRHD